MTVINNTTLLVRRIEDLQRRREGLVERQDWLRRSLPEWTFAPLQLVGMSSSEIRSMMNDLSRAESASGLHEIDKQLEELDRQIEDLENAVLTTQASSLGGIHAVLELALARFRAQTTTDPSDVFYDYGDARVLSLLERACSDFSNIMAEEQRRAG